MIKIQKIREIQERVAMAALFFGTKKTLIII